MIEIDRRIISEDGYLSAHGGGCVLGTSASVLAVHNSAQAREAPKFVLKQCLALEPINSNLRKEYHRLIEAGCIRDFTHVEKLILMANGHEDNQATHAARRALKKRGIDYTTVKKIEF